tara:strand:+ start:4855 stop:5004 length:150 start_codon:yes stop_codon:yes gene_type:complete
MDESACLVRRKLPKRKAGIEQRGHFMLQSELSINHKALQLNTAGNAVSN